MSNIGPWVSRYDSTALFTVITRLLGQGLWPAGAMLRASSGEENNATGFYEVLDQVVQLLRHRGRVTYRALKREFQLDDAFLEDLKDELIKAQHLAVDEQGDVLVWTGGVGPAPAPGAPPSTPRGEPA